MWSCAYMNLEQFTYAYYDYPEIFEELTELNDREAIHAGVESILTGGSGSITLQSPNYSGNCRCRRSGKLPGFAGRLASSQVYIPAVG